MKEVVKFMPRVIPKFMISIEESRKKSLPDAVGTKYKKP